MMNISYWRKILPSSSFAYIIVFMSEGAQLSYVFHSHYFCLNHNELLLVFFKSLTEFKVHRMSSLYVVTQTM